MVLVGLCGVAIVAGARLSWISARGTRPASGINETSVTGLLHWSYQPCHTFVESFSFAVIVAGVGVVIGGLVASRLLAALFSFLAIAAAGLWIGLNATHYSPTTLSYADLRVGAWLTIGGAVIGLIGSSFLRSRRI